MKKQAQVVLAKLDKGILSGLTREVKETLAFELSVPAVKIFTTADLWNIRRQSNRRIQRRFL
ncbi:MAG: hypothetical protein WKI04_01140 [Ferruginibacter sp.]